MEKDFDRWNDEKKLINGNRTSKLFYEREIWWCSFGVNIGVETDGKGGLYSRPCIVVTRFNKDMALVIPVTTRYKKENKYQFTVVDEKNRNFAVYISQIRVMSSKRFISKMSVITEEDFNLVIHGISAMIQKQPLTTNSAYAEFVSN